MCVISGRNPNKKWARKQQGHKWYKPTDRPFVPSTRPHPSDVGGKRERLINTRTLRVWVAPNDVSGGAGAARARVGVLAFDFRSGGGGGEPLSHARVVCVLDAERRPRGSCDGDQVPRALLEQLPHLMRCRARWLPPFFRSKSTPIKNLPFRWSFRDALLIKTRLILPLVPSRMSSALIGACCRRALQWKSQFC